MKRAVAFLLALFIFVAPVTTLVKADVVIGDNDDTIINENATILGRKLALLESFSDLALSGVTEFTISNTNDVDSYLDYLWGEVNNALDSLSDGTGFQEISNTLKSKYFTNLVQYKDYIFNRGNYLSQLLPSGNPTTNLLSTFFADNIMPKTEIKKSDLALDAFKALSRYNNTETPTPDVQYMTYINRMNSHNPYSFYWDNAPLTQFYGGRIGGLDRYCKPLRSYDLESWFVFDTNGYVGGLFNYSNSGWSTNSYSCTTGNIKTLQINSIGNDQYTGIISDITIVPYCKDQYDVTWCAGRIQYNNGNYSSQSIYWDTNGGMTSKNMSYTGTLSQVFNYFQDRCKNVNIYVDDVCWALVGDVPTYPTLDIDGFLKLYDNNSQPQYYLQPNTKIDYNELYTTIYNAIRDSLPISQGDITYYDSHDTIYSPTIINNYGEEEGDESDLIDTILDYAVIPKFDTSIAQPMRHALTNGVVIMNNSITNVIPDEILLILGACFFLLLFAVVINRMIK